MPTRARRDRDGHRAARLRRPRRGAGAEVGRPARPGALPHRPRGARTRSSRASRPAPTTTWSSRSTSSEILARVRGAGPPGAAAAGEAGGLVARPGRPTPRARETGEVLLTPTEYRMLAAITSRPGEVVRRRTRGRCRVARRWRWSARTPSTASCDGSARKLESIESPRADRDRARRGFRLRGTVTDGAGPAPPPASALDVADRRRWWSPPPRRPPSPRSLLLARGRSSPLGDRCARRGAPGARRPRRRRGRRRRRPASTGTTPRGARAARARASRCTTPRVARAGQPPAALADALRGPPGPSRRLAGGRRRPGGSRGARATLHARRRDARRGGRVPSPSTLRATPSTSALLVAGGRRVSSLVRDRGLAAWVSRRVLAPVADDGADRRGVERARPGPAVRPRRPPDRTRSGRWATPSTRCWTRSPARSWPSSGSPPSSRTSCARRSPPSRRPPS